MINCPTWEELEEMFKPKYLGRTVKATEEPEQIKLNVYEPGLKFRLHGNLEEGSYDV